MFGSHRAFSLYLGSPPHTRGKVYVLPYYGALLWDHPRTRGEKSEHCHAARYQCRITPAHAGKRSSVSSSVWQCRDHPRTRGEKFAIKSTNANELGSPPHTRGKATETISSISAPRITPAHAGKSLVVNFNFYNPQDHPRTRGEKELTLDENARSEGSPPHTRGKVARFVTVWTLTRITPAHAGKSQL